VEGCLLETLASWNLPLRFVPSLVQGAPPGCGTHVHAASLQAAIESGLRLALPHAAACMQTRTGCRHRWIIVERALHPYQEQAEHKHGEDRTQSSQGKS
jgi:hypothetical protein